VQHTRQLINRLSSLGNTRLQWPPLRDQTAFAFAIRGLRLTQRLSVYCISCIHPGDHRQLVSPCYKQYRCALRRGVGGDDINQPFDQLFHQLRRRDENTKTRASTSVRIHTVRPTSWKAAYQRQKDLRSFRISVVLGFSYLQPSPTGSGRVLGTQAGTSASTSHSACQPTAPGGYFESLMHYSGTNFCAWLFLFEPVFAAISLPIYSLCFPRPHHSFSLLSSRVYQPDSLLVRSFYRHLSCSFIFWVPLRSVHLCHSLERTTHIPLDTSTTPRTCTTNHHDESRRRPIRIHQLVDSQANPRSLPVVQSLLRSIPILSYNNLYNVSTDETESA